MNNIVEELKDIADKAEAGDKLHWAKAIRAGALQLNSWQRDIERLRLPTELQAELVWCRDEGNTGPRTHALLVELCERLTPNAEFRRGEALALPADDTALQQRLAQERERCAKVVAQVGGSDEFACRLGRAMADAIRSMK